MWIASQTYAMKKLPKNSGFKIPEGYLEGFTEKLLDKLGEKTSGIPDKEGFKVPETYFEDLNERLLEQVSNSETKVVKLHPYRKYYLVAASMAAIVLLLIGLQWQGNENLTFEDLAGSDIETYLDGNDLELSSYEIAEMLPIDDLQFNDILEENLDEENIIEYLDDASNDIEELNFEFDEE